MDKLDVIIIGAGASGLMCAIEAGKRKRRVVVLDHSDKPGKKIMMAGGGRCNFTNMDLSHANFISYNPNFCKSAIKRFNQWDFIDLVIRYGIPYHEREHGQLFCDNSSKDILDMLLKECAKAGVSIRLKTEIEEIEALEESGFRIKTDKEILTSASLVIATGGLSIPGAGASSLGYRVAEQFGIKVHPTRAGLVPFTLRPDEKERFSSLSGIAMDSIVSIGKKSFRENILFTHRGLSGPAILQISSYWQPGDIIRINLLPDANLADDLKENQKQRPQIKLKTFLAEYLPKRVVAAIIHDEAAEKPLQEISHKKFNEIAAKIQDWNLKPNGTEGYRTAEVTCGGVDCDAISSKTMEAKAVPGLYFTGEVLDVTGWLGGYNLQWAWSSGWCAGQYC